MFLTFICILSLTPILKSVLAMQEMNLIDDPKATIDDSHFLYFGYGSNLLKKRIHLRNPTALFIGIGRLDHHRLDFSGHSETWKGAVATVVPTEGSCVYGTIWKLEKADMEHLDAQEGVPQGTYKVQKLNVVMEDGSKVLCRIYEHTKRPPPYGKIEDLPENRWPSASYMRVVREGAKESKLPAGYVKFLMLVPDNGHVASIEKDLEMQMNSRISDND